VVSFTGIRTTFYTKTLSVKNIFKRKPAFFIGKHKKSMKNLKVIASMQMTRCLSMKLISRNGTKVLALMEDYLSQQGISQQLFKVEIDNLKIYGYGIKGYILYD
jgi:hypothetical protein